MVVVRWLLLVVLLFLPSMAAGAVLHGTVYDWSTFEPLSNVIVEVNSTPAQFMVAVNGSYSFNLPPGDYLLQASYYRGSVLEYQAEENITIPPGGGDIVRDILLFPSLDTEEEPEFSDLNLDAVKDKSWNINMTLLSAIVFVIVLLVFFKIRGLRVFSQAGQSTSVPTSMPREEIPPDLAGVLEIIKASGGRITQKDLRKNLKCSEAKVSLMLADLESRGLIKKIKKGRGNIIILEEAT